jgi:cytochrome c peroxidase
MYDGATDHLDLLPIIPLTNPVEMNADLSAVGNDEGRPCL